MAFAAGLQISRTCLRSKILFSARDPFMNSNDVGGSARARFHSLVRSIFRDRSCRVARIHPNASGSVTPRSAATQATHQNRVSNWSSVPFT